MFGCGKQHTKVSLSRQPALASHKCRNIRVLAFSPLPSASAPGAAAGGGRAVSVCLPQVRRAAGRRAAAAASSSSAPRSSSSTPLKSPGTPTRAIRTWTLLPLPGAVYHKQPCSLAFCSWPCKDNGDNCAAWGRGGREKTFITEVRRHLLSLLYHLGTLLFKLMDNSVQFLLCCRWF